MLTRRPRTCTPNIHWIVPILAGIPFGAGNAAVFIYASNYLVNSYSIYAASALAGNAVLRSILGATLPLAGPAMYARLGPNWAGTLLGLLEAICIPIPLVFYLYGGKIRARSKLIQVMQEDKRRHDEKKERARVRRESVEGIADQDVEKTAVERGKAEASAGSGMRTGAAVGEVETEKRAAEVRVEAEMREKERRG